MNVCDAASSSVEDPGNDGPPRTKTRKLVLEANNQGNCIFMLAVMLHIHVYNYSYTF